MVRPAMAKPHGTASLPTGIVQRMLTREEAAAYLALSPYQFDERVRPHLPAARWGNSVRFDIRALDLYLDRISGLDSAVARSRDELDVAFGSSHRT